MILILRISSGLACYSVIYTTDRLGRIPTIAKYAHTAYLYINGLDAYASLELSRYSTVLP